jgi:hypothetical protein
LERLEMRVSDIFPYSCSDIAIGTPFIDGFRSKQRDRHGDGHQWSDEAQ